MGRVPYKVLKLTAEQRKQLEDGANAEGKSIIYRARCLALLMKSEGMLIREIEKRTGLSPCTIYSLMSTFEKDGIEAIVQTPKRRGLVHRDTKPFIDTWIFRRCIKLFKNRIRKVKNMWIQSYSEGYSDDIFVEYMCGVIREVCAEDSKAVDAVKNKE